MEHKNQNFDDVLAKMPRELQNEITEMDAFIKSLRPLNFKRTIDKYGTKITYVSSEFGVSYAVKLEDENVKQLFWWYIIHKGKPETWHRKADYMEETLAEIAKSDIMLSERIFNALKDCNHCYGAGCLAKTIYMFNGNKRLTCHGRVTLTMCQNDLSDVKEFFKHLNIFMERKTTSGASPMEKIILVNTKRSL